MKRILVTGAGGNASQSFVNSLRMSAEPFHVVGVDTSPIHMECSDLQARYLVPKCSDPAYVDAINGIIEKEKIQFLHPQPDVEVAMISEKRAQFKAPVSLPDANTIRVCHDKTTTNQKLRDFGVPVPRSIQIANYQDLGQKFFDIKRESDTVWVRATSGAGSKGALPVKTYEQAANWIRYWEEMKGLGPQNFMVAEFLPGREFAFQSLWHKSELVTCMARERMEYMFGSMMVSGQSSSPSIARTVHRDDVNTIAMNAIRALDPAPHGVYCVDLKENSRGTPSVTEINIGRFFTTSNFFSAAGLNMPHMYVKLAFGEEIPEYPKTNPLPADLYWVRGIDRLPRLFQNANWSSIK
ncbi:MAG TPA: ATP-grasp domain-containing protein [Bdellovibrionales bacterium]|nr:ATP-grasp domain-containing protein [Bdellovibrionales bacterium]